MGEKEFIQNMNTRIKIKKEERNYQRNNMIPQN